MKHYEKPLVLIRVFGCTDKIAAIPAPPGFTTKPGLDNDVISSTIQSYNNNSLQNFDAKSGLIVPPKN